MTARLKRADRTIRDLVAPVAGADRIEVIRVFGYRAATTNEVAAELGLDPTAVQHHVKVLREYGCIESVRKRQRRGATEHFYRALAPAHFEDEEWAKLSKSAREEISPTLLRAIVGEIARAVDQGTFDARPDRHLSWLPMELDEQGWQELVEKQRELLGELTRIKAESAERLLASGDGRRVVAATLGFETPPGFGFRRS